MMDNPDNHVKSEDPDNCVQSEDTNSTADSSSLEDTETDVDKSEDPDDYVKSEDNNSTAYFPGLEDCDTDVNDDVDFDEAIIPTIAEKKPVEILIEIDQDRKKVITLNDGGYNSLVELFFEAVADDPRLKEYANSTFVFQIFSQKFNTWIDLDRSKELVDGSSLKAIFLTQTQPGTESVSERRKSNKRRQADSSDNCSHCSCKCKASCLSDDDSTQTKRICQSIKACVSDTAKDNATSTVSERNHDLDWVDNSGKQEVSESQSVSPVSQGELHCLSLGLSGKNPVSALHELCAKLRWKKPVFEIVEQDLSLSDPRFLMKVTIMDCTYIPDKYERRKQLAKTAAAECCLKKLGVFK